VFVFFLYKIAFARCSFNWRVFTAVSSHSGDTLFPFSGSGGDYLHSVHVSLGPLYLASTVGPWKRCIIVRLPFSAGSTELQGAAGAGLERGPASRGQRLGKRGSSRPAHNVP